MHPDLATELSDALGGRVTQMRAVGGGDTHPAWQLTFADASQCFVKTGPDPAPLQDEVQGLAWLRAA
ncbi:MAG: fructosamine kinase, partial [Polyangiales bacterium]